MGSREDIMLLRDNNVDAAEVMAGWRYYLHNSRPGEGAAFRSGSASSMSRYYLDCTYLARAERRIGNGKWNIGIMLEAWIHHGGTERTEFFSSSPLRDLCASVVN
jgi:hypothetical protein